MTSSQEEAPVKVTPTSTPVSTPATQFRFKVNKPYHNKMHVPRRKTVYNFYEFVSIFFKLNSIIMFELLSYDWKILILTSIFCISNSNFQTNSLTF
jgi:hypothetical protein